MTARWSGAVHGRTRRKRPPSEDVLDVERWRVFPQLPGEESPEVMFHQRVLVTRNVGCRSGFEASWRDDRGKPQGLTRA
jgi:hypothetical protein